MSKLPRSTDPEAIRKALRDVEKLLSDSIKTSSSLASKVKALEEAPPAAATVPDSVPRTIVVTLDYTDFNTVSGTIDVLIGSYPPGSTVTYVRIEPVIDFDAPGIGGATMEIPAPATGSIATSATYKLLSVAAPSAAPADQAALAVYLADNSGPADFYARLSLAGCTGDQLTAGQVRIHLTICVPGSASTTLPAS